MLTNSCTTEELEKPHWFPKELNPVIDVMLVFREVKDGTFLWDLKDGWAESIQTFTQMFCELQVYSTDILKHSLPVTWKVHCIAWHLEPFLLEVS